MRRVLIGCLLLGLTAAAHSAPLVKHADFGHADGWSFATPAWTIVDDDGHSGSASLRLKLAQPQTVAPATTSVVLAPNTDYLLTAWVKAEGKLRPTIVAGKYGLVTSQAPHAQWSRLALRFNSGGGGATVLSLYADDQQVRGGPVVGTAWFDDVQVVPAAEATAEAAADQPAHGRNLALGRPYTLQPSPNYALCTDPGDAVQLTDGEYSIGYFWTQKSTVGWSSGKPIVMTIDLGKDEPIGGLSFSTAAGVAGVTWPATILVCVSDDNKHWFLAGDLISLAAANGLPPTDRYATWRFQTDALKTHGRYVSLLAAPGTGYFFVDEIEVYQGPEALLSAPRDPQPFDDLKKLFQQRLMTAAVKNGVNSDLIALRHQIGESKLAPREQQRLLQELDAAQRESETAPPVSADFLAVLPYSPAQRKAWQARAALWRASGLAPLTVWSANAWDPVQPTSLPAAGATARLALPMMRHEIRSVALNLTNASDQEQTLTLRAAGLPGGELPAWLSVQQVAWTGVQDGSITGSALPDAKRTAAGWEVSVPAGSTRQVWLTVDSTDVPAGRYAGRLLVGGKPVPFDLRVSRLAMPDALALSLGGWDYTDGNYTGIDDRNRDQVVAFLKRYHVDTPWAGGSVMPFGSYAADGTMTTKPDTKRMDTWLARWQGARQFAVFNSFSEPLADTPVAKKRAAEWINFWVQHLAEKGLKPSQLLLLIFDEPHETKGDQVISTWGKAIREAQPEVAIFTDPTWDDPRKASVDMLDVNTILCPNRPMWMQHRKEFEGVFLPRLAKGQKLAFYSCSGPVRMLDPYGYHRAQAWEAFRYGMTAEYYWAFSDNGGATAWNEYAAPGTCYSPQFLGPDGCVTAKQMEGVRQGLYDYQYLVMLRDAVDAAEQAGGKAALVAEGRKLLTEGPLRVLNTPGMEDIMWAKDRDRSIADQVRLEVLDLLERLNG